MKFDNMEESYLSIAEIHIRLIFSPTDNKHIKTAFVRNLLETYRGFIEKVVHRVDFTVLFCVNDRAELLFSKNKKKAFINFFQCISPTRIKTYYQISLFQFQIILIDILHRCLARKKGFLLHASANSINGQTDIFAGPHGAGKSTLMKILRPTHTARADDSVIIKKSYGKYSMYQTPFIEKESCIKTYDPYLLGRIFFIRKSNEYRVEKITSKDFVLTEMLKEFWTIGTHKDVQLSHLLDFISSHTKFYYLYFGKSRSQVIQLLDENKS